MGRIGGPHGVQGWLHLTSLTDPPASLATLTPLWLGRRGEWTPAEALTLRPHGQRPGRYLLRVPGVADRTAAEALRGAELGILARDLPALDTDSYYWRDLCGLAVRDPSGARLGVVADVLETPAHAVLVVAVDDAHRARLGPARARALEPEVLVPFVREFTGAVDLDTGTIEVDWPDVFDPAPDAEAP